jgi:hypothetical protein
MSDTTSLLALDLHSAIARITGASPSHSPPPKWLASFEHLGILLGGDEATVKRFVELWRRLYRTTLVLDHLEDADPLDEPWLAAQPQALQYHLALSAYALASHELTLLAQTLSPGRGTQLQQLWSSTIFQLAAGQYQDLTAAMSSLSVVGPQALDRYEEIAVQKTGAAFALVLGGCACIAIDEATLVDAATSAGVVIGMLLQYYDDLLDEVSQQAQPETVTLVRAWASSVGNQQAPPARELWQFIYARYAEALERILAPMPAPVCGVIFELLRTMFGPVPGSETAAQSGRSCSHDSV